MSELMQPMPVVRDETYFTVYVQWKIGPGGRHRCTTYSEALDEAEAMVRLGFGEASKGQAIHIEKIVLKTWHFPTPTPESQP